MMKKFNNMKEEAGAAGEIRVVEEKPRKNLASQHQSSLGLPLSLLCIKFNQCILQKQSCSRALSKTQFLRPSPRITENLAWSFGFAYYNKLQREDFFKPTYSWHLLQNTMFMGNFHICSSRENCRIICEYDAQHLNSDEAFYVMRVGDRMLFSMIPMMNVGVQRGNPAKQQSTCHSTNAQCLHCPLMKCAIFSSPALVRHPSKVCCCCCCSVSCSKSTGCASKLASMPALE